MPPKIEIVKKHDSSENGIILLNNTAQIADVTQVSALRQYLEHKLKKAGDTAVQNQNGHISIFGLLAVEDKPADLEKARRMGHSNYQLIHEEQIEKLQISGTASKAAVLAYVEGMLLSHYQFNKYKKNDEAKRYLSKIKLYHNDIKKADIEELLNVVKAVYTARDLVNEPVIYLTAKQLASEFERMGKEAGFDVEVLGKNKIQSLKMGGLLAVNLGAPNPPTFTIMEYKPAKAVNKKPIVLVGKGVVFDTGGLSLKPTPGSMDAMKCDMAGAATVGAAIYAAALNKLPVHVIALVPATENRPDGNAVTPGDVITMMSGTTVEVLNTDAEGRLILADALHYAKRYKPELVVDFATLTGAAARAIGKEGIVYMGTADEDQKAAFNQAGHAVHERLVEFPLWEEYEAQIKSHVADLKNLGGADAGAITAGAFLNAFTDYPWLHFDIAGPAFLESNDHYRPKGGTGVGVRLLYQYLKHRVEKGKA
jgi:leucyl aminopeptidase